MLRPDPFPSLACSGIIRLMKKREVTEIICRRYCKYYKEGKEDLLCGTYRFLAERYSAGELERVPEEIAPDFSGDAYILEEICKGCEFVADGCDFRGGNPGPPCGGYYVVEWLRKQSG